jgi:hypothetical protein
VPQAVGERVAVPDRAPVPAAETVIKPASGREHRRDDRYPVEGHAEVIVFGEPRGTSLLRGRILDISVSGCFIQTIARVRLQPETKVEIFFAVKGKVIRAIGASRFSKSKVGIGFRFLAMSVEMQDKLDELINDARAAWMALSAESRAMEHGLADTSQTIGSVQNEPHAEAGATRKVRDEAEGEGQVRPAVWNPLGVNGHTG